jgi:hypothetical protein
MARITVDDNQLTPPAWAGDFLNREHLIPGGAKLDAAAFNAPDAVVVVVGAAGALAAATAVPVDALPGPIPSGTVLNFGTNKFARLTAAAAAGATSLTVAALPTALVDNDTATYAGIQTKNIPSGTFIGRTFAERETGDAFGPADAADEEFFLTAFDVTDADNNADVELYRPGSIVKENFLPGWATMSSALKTDLRATYTTTKGVN